MTTDGTAAATARRIGLLIEKLAGDAVRANVARAAPADGVWDTALAEGMNWLVRSHDATGRRGSSRGYSLLTGWAAAFPETSGYLIGTMITYGASRRRTDLMERARELADWELEVQDDDGGIMQGLITRTPRRSIAFNTGMVLHGWIDAYLATGTDEYLDAAHHGGRWLIERQDPDGAWRGDASYRGIPHTYKSRVSWALIRLANATAEDQFQQAAIRNLDWVVSRQRPNGWFDDCVFEPGTVPNTHGIAYTLRGLVESYALVGDERYLTAAQLTSRVLIDELLKRDTLPATWKDDWTPGARYRCLTGIVQLGGTWLRIYELTGDDEFKRGGLRAVEHAAAHQLRADNPDLRGALPGSFPIYGLYAPLACPNWATKFLIDGLLLRERVTAADSNGSGRPVWG